MDESFQFIKNEDEKKRDQNAFGIADVIRVVKETNLGSDLEDSESLYWEILMILR